MDASTLYRDARLGEAIEAQVAEVREDPLDHSKRLFLFELLIFAGELDRASKQLEAVSYEETQLDLAVQMYRQLIDSERARRQAFAEPIDPELLGEPAEHLSLRLRALDALRQGHPAEAASLLRSADEATPTRPGLLNDRPFRVLRDADDLLGGVLEVMANGRYYWVGLDQIARVEINPPRFPRDLIFIPASLEVGDRVGNVFLPALYPGTHASGEDVVRLGRRTDWLALEGGPTLGSGLHTYLIDDDAIGLLEWRAFQASQAPAGPDAGAAPLSAS